MQPTLMDLPEGYRARPPTRADAPAVAALIAACQVADGDRAESTAEDVLNDWLGTDLEDMALLICAPDGQVVACADLLTRHYVQTTVYGYVHPAQCGRGLGTALIQWGEGWAHAHMELAPAGTHVAMQTFVRSSNASACRLAEALGYALIRTHYWMQIVLDEPPPAPQWPAGVGVRTYVAGQDDDTLFEAAEESFQDIWNRPPGTQARWLMGTQAEGFDPTLWFLPYALDSGTLAGVCLCSVISGSGQISTLGVRRPWRRQGLGLALLRHAFGEFYRRGVYTIGLSVDAESPTGAPRLYASAGMRVVRSYSRYAKDLRAGAALRAEG